MSKKIGFPVLSATITGVLFILALLLGTLTIFVTGLGLGGAMTAMINGLLFFIGAFLAALALISYTLHPDLEDNQRYAVAIFLVIFILVLFNAGVSFAVMF